MISEFYFGTAWHWPLPYLPRIMLSYNFTRTLKKAWQIDKPLMMDSGAFSVILKYGQYPYSPQEYAAGIEKWKPDIAWTMDYPCEPSVRESEKYNPREAQEMTFQNQIKLQDLNANTQMVVQGWAVSDYLENLDRIKEQGLLTERLGIGSICRRGQISQIAGIIRTIHANVPGWVKLHGFGVKKTVITNTDAKYYLYSADSVAWDYNARYGEWLKGNHNGQTYKDKVPRLKQYIENTERLLNPTEPLMEALQ